MCGIFGYTGQKQNAAKLVLDGLKTLEYRGYDSWGVAAVPIGASSESSSPIIVKKKAGKIGDATVNDMPKSSYAFGHTRWATHGGVTDVNAHPHLGCKKEIAVIHNGIIENFSPLKNKLIKSGHKFISDTDTEIAAHLIEEHAKSMLFSKAVQKAFNELKGLNAIIAMKKDETQFVAVRNGSPLVVGFGTDENLLASDAAALLPYTKHVHFLEDNQMAIVASGGVMIFDVKSGDRIRPKKQTLTWSVTDAQKGQYPYFMLKEIHEQPAIISEIAADSIKHSETIARAITRAQETHFVGCGTASYASIAATYFFAHIANIHTRWGLGSEFATEAQFLDKHALVMALSQSGETMDTLEAVKEARKRGARIGALVNVLGSTLYRQADLKMLIGAGPEKGVASTKAFIGKLAHLLLLAFAANGDANNGQKLLVKAAQASKALLTETAVKRVQKLAKLLQKNEHIFVVGRGISYAAALETALKIKEISYIHAEGFAAGELKHGVIALVEKGTPCIVIAPLDETHADAIGSAMEMKARGGYIIGISPENNEVFDEHIPVKDVGVATIIPNIIVAQLLAYYLTIARGYDPDMPRNLAKSVTVK